MGEIPPPYLAAVSCLLLSAQLVASEPWFLPPGDLRLRHEMQLLVDHGVLNIPVTTWPLPPGDLARVQEALKSTRGAALPLAGLRGYFDSYSASLRYEAATRLTDSEPRLRSFADDGRGQSEITGAVEATSAFLAGRVEATAVDDPSDRKRGRLDGSYLADQLGNWVFSANAVDRWWGPGWSGSLILSSNARPVPALMLQRSDSRPLETAWLSWIGPWQFVTFMGKLESDREIPNALLFGLRVVARPLAGFELGFSRAAQWGGEGRPQGLDTFVDLLLGRDNVGDSGTTAANEPGNQLAGFDFRYSLQGQNAGGACYSQMIGEDEAGGLPSQYLTLLGFEVWGAQSGSPRWVAEYADTTAGGLIGSRSRPGSAYGHGLYTDGYRYRREAIGHPADGDSRIASLKFILPAAERTWDVSVSWGELNRSGQRLNSTGPSATDIASLTARAVQPSRWGEWTAVLETTKSGAGTSSDTHVRAELGWRMVWR